MDSRAKFESAWVVKLAGQLKDHAGVEIGEAIMDGCELHKTSRPMEEIVASTHDAVKRLKLAVNEETFHNIMTGCACLYPSERLKPMKDHYAATGDLVSTHKMLQEQFEADVKVNQKLSDKDLDFIRTNYWGVAGRLEGNYIYATKMPTRFHDFMAAKPKEEKDYNYCHCPRIKDVFLKPDLKLTKDFCYCSAGYYKDIWQQIIGKSVKVEVLKSLLGGDDVCLIRVQLPTGDM